MTINTELEHGISLLTEQFPNTYVTAEESMTINSLGTLSRNIRLAVVNLGECYSGTANTAEAAFAILMADFNKPKTEAIQKARELLEKEGFSVSPVS
jgi:hypothetical protein